MYVHADEYAHYDPDRPEEHRHHDVGSDVGITAKYNTAVDFSDFILAYADYNKIIQSLNVKHNDLGNHVINWI